MAIGMACAAIPIFAVIIRSCAGNFGRNRDYEPRPTTRLLQEKFRAAPLTGSYLPEHGGGTTF